MHSWRQYGKGFAFSAQGLNGETFAQNIFAQKGSPFLRYKEDFYETNLAEDKSRAFG